MNWHISKTVSVLKIMLYRNGVIFNLLELSSFTSPTPSFSLNHAELTNQHIEIVSSNFFSEGFQLYPCSLFKLLFTMTGALQKHNNYIFSLPSYGGLCYMRTSVLFVDTKRFTENTPLNILFYYNTAYSRTLFNTETLFLNPTYALLF